MQCDICKLESDLIEEIAYVLVDRKYKFLLCYKCKDETDTLYKFTKIKTKDYSNKLFMKGIGDIATEIKNKNKQMALFDED